MQHTTSFFQGFSSILFGRPALSGVRITLRKIAALNTLSEFFQTFGFLIPDALLRRRSSGANSRERRFTLHVTFWAFLAQTLAPQTSCRDIVRKVQAWWLLRTPGPVAGSSSTAAYTKARQRLGPEIIRGIGNHLVARLEGRVQASQLWLGRRVRMVNGTTVSMPDTPENQEKYPQSSSQKAGCGFPQMRVVGLFSLASGALLEHAEGNTSVHESMLFGQLMSYLEHGYIVPGDPNCAFYWKCLYHLHYIYDHNGCNFAHVTSRDMVHWTWQPTSLKQETVGHGMFSGTGFITKDGMPSVIYHGAGSGRNQIAVAEDNQLQKWSKPWKLEPRIQPGQDSSKIANWDADAWLDGDTYYALSDGTPGSGQPPTLFKSTDLKNWDYLGLFLAHDMPAVQTSEDVSCPNFFKIGDKHMLLCISHNLGCSYYLGDWKDEKFAPEFHARMTWNGNHFFAPESVVDKDGRRMMWAWLLNLPVAPTGVQSLPPDPVRDSRSRLIQMKWLC